MCFTYDALDRLLSASPANESGAQDYCDFCDYDAIGISPSSASCAMLCGRGASCNPFSLDKIDLSTRGDPFLKMTSDERPNFRPCRRV
jgi:hypothetical protein